MRRVSAHSFILPAILFGIGACLVCLFWWWMGRPVPMPSPPLAQNEKLHCVSYAPFRGGQNPLDPTTRIPAWQIDDDLAALKPLTDCVRTYSIQHALDQIPPLARKHGLKVMQGIWLSSDRESNKREIDAVVQLVKQYPDVVASVIVGNEVLLRGELSGPDLAAAIRDVKARVDVPVTYADVWEFWLRHRDVYDAVDFVTIHILPYWEDFPISARDSALHIESIRRKMALAFPGKEILIGETGFPSRGRMREGAVPSPSNQARVVHDVVALAKREGWRLNLIEAFDQPWKRRLEGTVGGYWGLIDAYERVPKFRWGAPVSDHPHWLLQAVGGVGLMTAAFGLALWARRRSEMPDARAWSGVFLCALTMGLMVPLAIELMPLESFTAGGWVRAAALAMTAVAAPVAVSLALVRGLTRASLSETLARRHDRERDPLRLALGGILAAALLLALHTALGLVFDPRYREFHYAPLTSAIVPFVVLALAGRGEVRRGAAEALAAGLLALSALYIAFNESLLNWQSLWLCALLAVFALTLWRARAAPG